MLEDYSFAGKFREQRKAIVPQDPDTNAFLYDVDCQTKRDVEERFGCIVNYDWHCNTIANCAVEAMIKAMNVDMVDIGAKYAKFNFYDLFISKVTTKINEKAEKEGNINISFSPGQTAINLIESDISKDKIEITKMSPADFFKIEVPDADDDFVAALNEKYLMIDRQARYVLSNNYAITISDDNKFMAFAICYCFIYNIFQKLLITIASHPEQNLVSVNFNDNIEFHCARDDDDPQKVSFAMRPGLHAKLLIKSDESTEFDDDDDIEDSYGFMSSDY